MPPIPIYSDAPITPTQAKGVTPQTAFEPTSTTNPPATTTQDSSSAYPAAQPGAAAVPAPTGTVPTLRAPPTRTVPSAGQAQNGPPPPQPGAVPTPPTQAMSTTNTPPPQAGSTPFQFPPVTTTPPQMFIPPPPTNAARRHSTQLSTPSSTRTGPTTIPLGVVNLPPSPHVIAESPGGYVQNAYAQEMSAAQRASLEAQEAAERNVRRGSLQHIFAGARNDGDLPATAGEDGVWGAVRGWASGVGKKAVELEGSVWKRVNGD